MPPTRPAETAFLDDVVVRRLYARTRAPAWQLPEEDFADAIRRSVARRYERERPGRGEVAAYLESLHLDDLALACACARGHEPAWDYFIAEFRPVMYRTAAALVGSDEGRDLADSLYAELYGLTEHEGQRRSHFDYYHGRSTLAGWLRAVLAQRAVDRARDRRRTEPLPEETDLVDRAEQADPDRARYLGLLRTALLAAFAALAPEDRLRLSLYYAQDLTLSQAGRLLREHEATVSRKLARSRQQLRLATERHLQEVERLSAAQVDRCFELAVEEWDFDVAQALAPGAG